MPIDRAMAAHGLLSRGYPGAAPCPDLHRDRRPVLERLDTARFKGAIDALPLVSIDLIVQCGGRYLLGRRNNPPARHTLFVPGGRIRKNELMADALHRVILDELGLQRPRGAVSLRGIFEHFYNTDFSGDTGASTHYIVLAHDIVLESPLVAAPLNQHSRYAWLTRSDILSNPDVHRYAKSYFVENP